MTDAALTRLSRNSRGFFLLVEEHSIDGADRACDPVSLVRAVRSLDRAVRVAVDFARRRGHTLVLVTADHRDRGTVHKLARAHHPPDEGRRAVPRIGPRVER